MILKQGLVFTGERRGEQHPGGSRRTSEKLDYDLDAVRLGLVPWGGPSWEGPSRCFAQRRRARPLCAHRSGLGMRAVSEHKCSAGLAAPSARGSACGGTRL